jgi:uncharacterized lipoprotein YajG|tara:strand:- start:229 stop:459 length:231 start_codon:yes stop_codon:yes gene_type:complete
MKMMLVTIATVFAISVLAGCMAQQTPTPAPKKKPVVKKVIKKVAPKKKVVTEDDRLKAAIKKNKLFLEKLRKKHGK